MKVKDGIMGLAVADALGVPFEFKRRGSYCATGMVGNGSHNQPEGTWSDDSSMTLATAESIGRLQKIDCKDIMENFIAWADHGSFSPYGEVFDIGITTRTAVTRYSRGYSTEECGLNGERDNGNGSLMRILPLAFLDRTEEEIDKVSSLTHAHEISKEGCRLYVRYAKKLIGGSTPLEAMVVLDSDLPQYKRLKTIKDLPEEEIKSSGYVVDTLEAAIWCLLNTDSYRECVLTAVNLGEDTDTVAAVAGGLAGIVYGYENIPKKWMEKIPKREWIENDICSSLEAISAVSSCFKV